MLSNSAIKRLMIAVGSQSIGSELADAVNQGAAAAAQDPWVLAAVIVAAHTSATTDFAALAVGDKLIHIPATAGNAAFESIVTKGTKPSAAVIGDLYIAVRAYAAPASIGTGPSASVKL